MKYTMLNDAVLSAAQCQAYQDDGFVILRNFFPAKLLEEVSHEADALLERHDLISPRNLRCRWQTHVETGECRFETFDPVIDIAPVCRRLATGERLLGALARLYREEAHLFKDKLIFKPPGVKGYGLHQDWIAWKGFPRSFLTVLIPIDASNVENGVLKSFAVTTTTAAPKTATTTSCRLPRSMISASC